MPLPFADVVPSGQESPAGHDQERRGAAFARSCAASADEGRHAAHSRVRVSSMGKAEGAGWNISYCVMTAIEMLDMVKVFLGTRGIATVML